MFYEGITNTKYEEPVFRGYEYSAELGKYLIIQEASADNEF